MKTILVLLCFSTFLTQCASSQSQRINELTLGMDKSDILDFVGSPNSSRFKNGQHEWIYIYYEGDLQKAKKLWFKNNHLVLIEDFDLQTQSTASEMTAKNVNLSPKEANELKKALIEKKRAIKEEEGFKDID
ncbi:MAG: hypothetical protein KDD40_01720 [Bdellovibrionales bacterium]|nr:hypothetical protein [Bdellovibrionales bacterium]